MEPYGSEHVRVPLRDARGPVGSVAFAEQRRRYKYELEDVLEEIPFEYGEAEHEPVHIAVARLYEAERLADIEVDETTGTEVVDALELQQPEGSTQHCSGGTTGDSDSNATDNLSPNGTPDGSSTSAASEDGDDDEWGALLGVREHQPRAFHRSSRGEPW